MRWLVSFRLVGYGGGRREVTVGVSDDGPLEQRGTSIFVRGRREVVVGVSDTLNTLSRKLESEIDTD